MKRTLLMSLLLVMLTSLFAGSVLADSHNNAWVRVIHASPDAPAVDVYVNGTAAVTNAPFKAATDYLTLPAGTHNVQIFATGSDPSGTPVLAADLTVEAGKKYSVAAVNTVANIELLITEDALSTTAGKSWVRFVHASPDAPNVDIALAGGAVLFGDVAFKGVGEYLEVDPGTVDLEARPAGTTDVALAIPGVELKADTAYTAYAVGLLGGEPALSAWLLVDATPMPAEMPQTGMGGASDTTGSAPVMPYVAAISVLALAVLAFTARKLVRQG